MAKLKAVVYGLGRNFENGYSEIHDSYNVIGYCDANPSRMSRFKNEVPRSDLKKAESEYDVLLITPENGFDIGKDLIARNNINPDKIRLLKKPKLAKQIKDRFVELWWGPKYISHGLFGEDMVVLYLCEIIGLDIKNVKYLELNLKDTLDGTATYLLHSAGSHGILVVDNYSRCKEQANVYRKKDIILDSRQYNDIASIEIGSHPLNMIVIRDNELICENLNEIFKLQPEILIVYTKIKQIIEKIRMHGFYWFCQLHGEVGIFCRRNCYRRA